MKTLFFSSIIFQIVTFGQEIENSLIIKWNYSDVRKVLSNPNNTLSNTNSIWITYEGYRQTLEWHKKYNVLLNFELCEFALNNMLSKKPRFTKNNRYIVTVDRIQEVHKIKGDLISQHLSSYLHSNSSFTPFIFITPHAFSLTDKTVINIGSP